MAYMSQAKKKELAPAIKNVLKKYGVKGSIGVDNHSSLVVTIREGSIDFIGMANAQNKEISERRGMPYYPNDGYIQVNHNYPENYGEAAPFIEELSNAMHGTDWYNNSDIMTDYFDVAWYVDINIGKWDKPYKLVESA